MCSLQRLVLFVSNIQLFVAFLTLSQGKWGKGGYDFNENPVVNFDFDCTVRLIRHIHRASQFPKSMIFVYRRYFLEELAIIRVKKRRV